MSDLTAELNLALCVDDDDTADYLTTTAGLRGSLNTLDGLFNQTTGHNHSGAHQGGGFTSLTLTGLTVNGNVSVTGTLTVQGATHLSTLQVDSALTTSSTLDVAGTSRLRGAVTADSTISAANTIRASAGQIVAPNGIGGFASRNAANTADLPILWMDSGNSTVVMAGAANTIRFVNGANSVQYGQYDASGNYIQQAGTMYVGGDAVVTLAAAQTLTNKTLNSPTINNASMSSPTLGTTTVSGLLTLNAQPAMTSQGDINIQQPRQIGWNPGGEWIAPGENIGRSGTVYMGTHGYVYFDLGVGHTVTCQNVVQTSDPRAKASMTVFADDTCMARVRDPGMQIYSYQLPPPTPSPDPPPEISTTPTDIGMDATQVYAHSPEFAALDSGNTPVGVNYSNMAALLWGALRNLDARCQAKGI